MFLKVEPQNSVSYKYDFNINLEEEFKKEINKLFNIYDTSELTNYLLFNPFNFKWKNIEYNEENIKNEIKENVENYLNEEDSIKWCDIWFELILLSYNKSLKKHIKEYEEEITLEDFLKYMDISRILKGKKIIENFNNLLEEKFPNGICFDLEETFEIGKYCYVSPTIDFIPKNKKTNKNLS